MDKEKAEEFYKKYEETFNRYLFMVTPKIGDPTYSILRSHLLFEELLRDYIALNFRHPEVLEGARLTFAQVLAIAKAGAIYTKPNIWHWTALEKLNKLRNLLAHHIDIQEINKKAEELSKFIANEIKTPLPEPAKRHGSRVEHAENEPSAIYTKIDMALVALYGVMSAALELERRFHKERQERLAANPNSKS